jgi:RNA polymerase sigma factor (sigma-70 family)
MSGLPLTHAELLQLDDSSLVDLAQQAPRHGDPEAKTGRRALAIVLLRRRDLVRSVVAAKVPGNAVDDLCSEVTIRFVRAVHRGGPIANPAGLLVRIAQRVRADYLDKRGQPSVPLEGWEPSELDGALDGEASRELCADLLALLTDRQREVVWLRIIEDRPSIEVAARLDTTPGTIDVILFRALRTMREAAR